MQIVLRVISILIILLIGVISLILFFPLILGAPATDGLQIFRIVSTVIGIFMFYGVYILVRNATEKYNILWIGIIISYLIITFWRFTSVTGNKLESTDFENLFLYGIPALFVFMLSKTSSSTTKK